jgi:hypothetical protein
MTGDGRLSRRSLLKRAGAVSVGAVSARGLYSALDELGIAGPERAAAATVRRRQEQYLIEALEVVLDNGVSAVVPPIYNDMITAKLASGTWTATRLKSARSRLESALSTLDSMYPGTAAGLTTVVGWGLPYFGTYVPTLWQANAPVDLPLSKSSGSTQYAVLDTIAFPSDPAGVSLEENHVVFKLRSDSQTILQNVERSLFEDSTSKLYVGDLFQLTSKRVGFLGRGFDKPSVSKQLALQNNVPGADLIPDKSQLMLGFTSTQTAALGPDNIVSFETLPGVTNQWPSGYFAAGCAMHMSHLSLDLVRWYDQGQGGFDYSTRVARMFSPHTPVPGDAATVTLPNGPSEVASKQQVLNDASSAGVLGHNETLQQATRLGADVVDNYGRLRPKGTAVPIREDFSTLDNPFAWPAGGPATAGLHFVVFTPASRLFHTARKAMDGVLPDGTDLRGSISDTQNGINGVMQATHRQNFVVPPRAHRSFPLVELMR